MVAYSDDKKEGGVEQVFGDIIGLISAAWMGLYSTLYAKLIPGKFEDKISFFNILGYMGVLWIIIFWPLLIIFHFTELETFELPHGKIIAYVSINIIFGNFLFEYAWGNAAILLGPLLANTSIILVVPFTMLIDSFFVKSKFTWMYYFGTALIVTGFFIISIRSYIGSRQIVPINEEEKVHKLNSNYNNNLNIAPIRKRQFKFRGF